MFPKATREKQSAWMPSITTTANRPKLEEDLPDALRITHAGIYPHAHRPRYPDNYTNGGSSSRIEFIERRQ
jgi:hypothetical protein